MSSACGMEPVYSSCEVCIGEMACEPLKCWWEFGQSVLPGSVKRPEVKKLTGETKVSEHIYWRWSISNLLHPCSFLLFLVSLCSSWPVSGGSISDSDGLMRPFPAITLHCPVLSFSACPRPQIRLNRVGENPTLFSLICSSCSFSLAACSFCFPHFCFSHFPLLVVVNLDGTMQREGQFQEIWI